MNVTEAQPLIRSAQGGWQNAFNLGSASSGQFQLEGGYYVLTASGNWGTYSTSTLTMANLPAAGDTVTVGGHAYRFELVGNLAQAYDVTLPASGTTAAKIVLALSNLAACINGSGTAGVNYYTTTANAEVSATVTATTLTSTAQAVGTAGNSYAVSTTTAGNTWSPATDQAGGAAGSITVQMVGPDGSTLLSTALTLSANGQSLGWLPPGTYQITQTTNSGTYAIVQSVPI
jgi:hypothetical protein